MKGHYMLCKRMEKGLGFVRETSAKCCWNMEMKGGSVSNHQNKYLFIKYNSSIATNRIEQQRQVKVYLFAKKKIKTEIKTN